jgi:hypothetical protein
MPSTYRRRQRRRRACSRRVADDGDVEIVSRLRYASRPSRDEIVAWRGEGDGLGRGARQRGFELDRIGSERSRFHVGHVVGDGLKPLFE